MIEIVVLQRGWIAVGRVERTATNVRLTDSHTVRRWCMTTKDGIGGLARRGPDETGSELDYEGTSEHHPLTEVRRVLCTWPGWDEWLVKSRKRHEA